ncbi:hypothetical protein WJX75_008622 [Coccomyxa subellipsoidea]|uniref:Glycoside hydrolase family 2 n=1 Tax=Coccomyxa subellipsoidea TaxID=248742 RepID=A0ABR2YU55_9CHLO
MLSCAGLQDCNPTVKATTGQCVPFKLATPWSCHVDPLQPHPEYPRPQLQRDHWQSLNGVWDWERLAGWETGNTPSNGTYSFKIVVPFAAPSDLSGVVAPFNVGLTRMLYHRKFTVPESWKNLTNADVIMLHIDKVDWEAEVWVNGVHVAQHRGGYDRFSMDITDALAKSKEGEHDLLVRVYDPSESAHIVLGKQRMEEPKDKIFYFGVQGIWGDVWMEPVSSMAIKRLDMIPDIAAGVLKVTAVPVGVSSGLPITVTAKDAGKTVATGQGVTGTPFNVTIPNMRLWSPNDPFQYDLEINVTKNGTKEVVDHIGSSRMGMAKISLGRVDPSNPDSPIRIFVNNAPLTLLGFLDQGFHPDGIYTASTDEALLYDIKVAKMMGVNVLRKHIKVEPDRFYYHAAREGILIIQDMPSMYYENDLPGRLHPEVSAGEKKQFEVELTRLVEDHRSFVSIMQYYAFNEGWGQYDTQRIVQMGHDLDPTRLWGAASGWIDPQDPTADQLVKVYQHYTGYVGDVKDDHNYPDPVSTGATATRASVVGEYGGIGMWLDGHNTVSRGDAADRPGNGPYVDNSTMFQEEFLKHLATLKDLIHGSTGVSAAIYTQLTDVETEPNGITSYDRKVIKFADIDAIRKEIEDLLEAPVN